MLISTKVKCGNIKVEGVNNACRLINEVMNEQIGTKMAQDIVNENIDSINRNQNWVLSKRIIGVKKKRVESLLG